MLNNPISKHTHTHESPHLQIRLYRLHSRVGNVVTTTDSTHVHYVPPSSPSPSPPLPQHTSCCRCCSSSLSTPAAWVSLSRTAACSFLFSSARRAAKSSFNLDKKEGGGGGKEEDRLGVVGSPCTTIQVYTHHTHACTHKCTNAHHTDTQCGANGIHLHIWSGKVTLISSKGCKVECGTTFLMWVSC